MILKVNLLKQVLKIDKIEWPWKVTFEGITDYPVHGALRFCC